MVALTFIITVVHEGLTPHPVVRLQIVYFLSFRGAVEVYAVALLVISVAEGHEIGQIILRECECHIFGRLQDFPQFLLIRYLLVFPPHMICHNKVHISPQLLGFEPLNWSALYTLAQAIDLV